MQINKDAFNKTSCTIGFGGVLFSLGIAVLLLKTWFLEFLAASILILKPNSLLEEPWLNTPMEIPLAVYFFNWTNPEDFRNFSVKPRFEQVGPYQFSQKMRKANVVWNDNDTVTYNQVREWYFEEDETKGSLADVITTANVVTVSFAHYVRDWNYFTKKAASYLISITAPEIHITRTVDELLIAGYDDLLLDLGNYFPFIEAHVPRFDKFAWLYIRNGSETFDGVFNMANGINGNFDIRNWNYENQTSYFDGQCGHVHGSGTEFYSTKLNKDHIDLFAADICRYVRLDFEEEVEVHGIMGYKYSVANSALDNGTLIPENECFCSGDCIPSGMVNMSSCRYGFPAFASLPHFYKADPVYLDAVDGLNPTKAQHETYVVLEPITALPLTAVARMQLNGYIHPISGITVYEDVPSIFFPLFWAEQRATLPRYARVLLKLFLIAPQLLLGFACILIILGLWLVFHKYVRTQFFVWRKTNLHTKSQAMNQEEIPLNLDLENNVIGKCERKLSNRFS